MYSLQLRYLALYIIQLVIKQQKGLRILVTQFNHPLIHISLGSDGCLATGEDTAEKNSEFRVGIEPMTSINDAGWMI